MSPFEQSRTALSDGQNYGIWSLIVTFFGDMAQGSDDRVSGKTLTAICEKLEIKPQAMRVALHRLRKDGWIDSVKTGRQSAYFLTDMGRIESAKASKRIYATRPPAFHGYEFLVAPDDVTAHLTANDWISVGPESYVNFSETPKPVKQALTSRQIGPLPKWLCDRLISKEIFQEYHKFHKKIGTINTEHWQDFLPHEVAALRVLLVHSWRRLILRHPALPAEAFPPDCPVEACYSDLTSLLLRLPDPKLISLE